MLNKIIIPFTAELYRDYLRALQRAYKRLPQAGCYMVYSKCTFYCIDNISAPEDRAADLLGFSIVNIETYVYFGFYILLVSVRRRR